MAGQFDTFTDPKDKHWSTREGIRVTGVKKELESEVRNVRQQLDEVVAQRGRLEQLGLDDVTKGRMLAKLDSKAQQLQEKFLQMEIPRMVQEWAEDKYTEIVHSLNQTHYNDRENAGIRHAYLDFQSRQSIASVLLRKALLSLAQTVDFRIRYARNEHGRIVPRKGFGGFSYSEEQRRMLLERMGEIALDPATIKDAILGYYTHIFEHIENPFDYKKGQRLPPTQFITRILSDARIREQSIEALVDLNEKNCLDIPRDILNEGLPEGTSERIWNVEGKKYKLLELTTSAELMQVGKLADNCIVQMVDELLPQQKGKNKGKPPTRFFVFCEIYDEPRSFKDALEGKTSSRMNRQDSKFRTRYRPHVVMEYQVNTCSVGQVKRFGNALLSKSDPVSLPFLQSLKFLRELDGVQVKNWGGEFILMTSHYQTYGEYVTFDGVKPIGGRVDEDEIISLPEEYSWHLEVPEDIDEEAAKFWFDRKPGSLEISKIMHRPEILEHVTDVQRVYALARSEDVSDAPTFEDFVLPNLRFAAGFDIWLNCNRLMLPAFEGFGSSRNRRCEFRANGMPLARNSRVEEVIAPCFSAGKPDEVRSDIDMRGVRLFECAHIGDNCRLIIQTPRENYPGLTIICPDPITKDISVGGAWFSDTRAKFDKKDDCWIYPRVEGLRRFATRAAYEAWVAKQEK